MPRGNHRIIIENGTKYGSLTIVNEAEQRGEKRVFLCECICGNREEVYLSHLRHSGKDKCRKCYLQKIGTEKVEVGEVFGKYTVIESIVTKYRNGKYVKCRCECGAINSVILNSLRRNRMAQCYSCGNRQKFKYALEERYPRLLYEQYRKSAKNRKIEFNLDYEDFKKIATGRCHYCGKKDTNAIKSSARKVVTEAPTFFYNGVDRVDSKSDYSVSNCVPCCKTCNRLKMAMPVDEFLESIKNVYEHCFLEITPI